MHHAVQVSLVLPGISEICITFLGVRDPAQLGIYRRQSPTSFIPQLMTIGLRPLHLSLHRIHAVASMHQAK